MQGTDLLHPAAARRFALPALGWVALGLLVLALWAPVAASLWRAWQADQSLSHGPLIPLIALGLLWARRGELGDWRGSSGLGLAVAGFSALLHVAAVWVDVAFLRPLSLIGMLAGGIGYLGGWPALRGAAGALGFLAFMIPWPTTLVARLAFPMQMTSSAYAALFGGIFGLPVQRDGVHLFVLPDPEKAPIYSVIVARQCSGLTSLIVLLALAYLIAYFTPAALPWRALMVASVVPVALFMNSVRVTLILFAGTHHSAAMAQWVHDHEAPVLIFFCSLALLGLRSAILAWSKPNPNPEGHPDGALPIVAP